GNILTDASVYPVNGYFEDKISFPDTTYPDQDDTVGMKIVLNSLNRITLTAPNRLLDEILVGNLDCFLNITVPGQSISQKIYDINSSVDGATSETPYLVVNGTYYDVYGTPVAISNQRIALFSTTTP
ncbi:MAG: hypothetical protein ACM3XS_09640, partial [Bacteroidota bacterium]